MISQARSRMSLPNDILDTKGPVVVHNPFSHSATNWVTVLLFVSVCTLYVYPK